MPRQESKIKPIVKIEPETYDGILQKLDRIEDLMQRMTTGNVSHKKGTVQQIIYSIRRDLNAPNS